MQIWIVILLVLSMIFVSCLAAFFSIIGLGDLFSGAMLYVWIMGISLEAAKFSLAGFLHQTWHRLHVLLRGYLLAAVIILSVITSMGIFGFLSNAYEQSSIALETETIKLDSLKNQLRRSEQEIERINRAIDEVPASRISKKMKMRAEADPLIKEINERAAKISEEITQANLKIVDVKKRVGPLIYIARAFKVDIDMAVKYLILLLVTVFDPLAICLVLAVGEAQKIRKNPNYIPTHSNAKITTLKMRFSKKNEAA